MHRTIALPFPSLLFFASHTHSILMVLPRSVPDRNILEARLFGILEEGFSDLVVDPVSLKHFFRRCSSGRTRKMLFASLGLTARRGPKVQRGPNGGAAKRGPKKVKRGCRWGRRKLSVVTNGATGKRSAVLNFYPYRTRVSSHNLS